MSDDAKIKQTLLDKVRQLRQELSSLEAENTELRQTDESLRIQRDLAFILSSTKTLHEASSRILEMALKVDGIDGGGIYLADCEKGDLNLIVQNGLPPEIIKSFSHCSPDSLEVAWAQKGKPAFKSYREFIPPYSLETWSEKLKAIAIVPVHYDGSLVAILSLISYTRADFSRNSRYTIETISTQIGEVIARIKANTMLHESQRDLQTLFNEIDDFLIILDWKGTILDSNPAMQKRLDYSSDELVGMNIFDLHSPVYTDRVYQVFADMKKNKVTVFRIPLQGKKGQQIFVEQKVSKGIWQNKEVLFASCRDIREQLETEKELGKYHNQLEELIKLRTKKLEETNDQLSREIIERHRVEKELGRSEKKYRSIVENIPILICRFLPKSKKITFVNDAYCRWFGKKPEEVIHHSIKEFVPENEHDKVNRKLESITQEHPIVTYEHQVYTPKGKRWQRWMDQALFDDDGQIIEYQSIGEDITEGKQAEEKLKLSETRYRELFNNMNNGVAVYEVKNEGQDFVFSDFNSGAEKIDKVKKTELTGRSVLDVFPGIKDFGLIKVLQRVWKTGQPEHYPVGIYSDGRITGWRENYVYKLPTGEIVAVYEDISERMKAEEAQRISEEKYRLLVENANECVIVIQDAQIQFANSKTMSTFGYSMDEMKSRNFIEFVHPEERQIVMDRHLKRLEGFNFPGVYKFRINHKNGDAIWMELNTAKITWEGKPATLNILSDITERLQVENKIKASLDEKEMLLKEIHHRVKNNLQIISSLLNLQSYKIKDKHTLSAIQESKNRINSMAHVHEKIVPASDFANINFSDYIQTQATELLRIYDISGNISLDMDVKDVLLGINEAIPCGLIINELMTNALKHAFPDRKQGTIAIRFCSTGANQYELIVRDDGVGMSADINIEETESLGLQLVSILSDQLNGQLEIERSNGTLFKIQFENNHK